MSSLTSKLYEFDQFRLDSQNRVLRRAGTAVSLTPKAFDLLLVLVQNAGKIVTKDELMKAVWPDSFVEESNLTQTIFMVRKALDETTDRRYILTVQSQGYRFLVPVREAAKDEPVIEAPPPPSHTGTVAEIQGHSDIRRATNWRWAIIASAVALVLIVVLAIWLWRSRNGSAARPDKIMLAILPFENFTGDTGQEYFSDGLTEEMISQLGDLDPGHLGVIARTSVMHYKHPRNQFPRSERTWGCSM